MIFEIKDIIKGKPRKKRSKYWRRVRNSFLKKHPYCAVCGTKRKREVHHIKPFHLYPELELDLDNLMTLCENKKYGINCHLLIGHLGNYKRVNYLALEDAKIWHQKLHEKKL